MPVLLLALLGAVGDHLALSAPLLDGGPVLRLLPDIVIAVDATLHPCFRHHYCCGHFDNYLKIEMYSSLVVLNEKLGFRGRELGLSTSLVVRPMDPF